MQKIQNKIHRAKKSLGQNFLKSEPALKKIIEVGEISPEDIILEIGPGKGALTKKLLEKSNYVIAIEKDTQLFEYLQDKFIEEVKTKKLFLLNENVLDFSASAYGLKPSTYKIIANIPYNITGAILKKFLTEENQPSMMVLMVQHEVAKRIMGNRENPTSQKLRGARESILSISVKAYGTPKLEMRVPARYFSPAPKVDSAIISIKNISRNLFTSPQPSPYKGEGEYVNEKRFWDIIHAGFAHKRKKLSSNLKKILKSDEKTQKNHERLLKNKRAEELSLSDWLLLTKN